MVDAPYATEELLSVHLAWLWPDALVVAVGEVDEFTVDALARRLEDAVDAGATRVVLDASGVSFMGVAGLRALRVTGVRLRAGGGELVVTDPPRCLLVLLGALRQPDELSLRWTSLRAT